MVDLDALAHRDAAVEAHRGDGDRVDLGIHCERQHLRIRSDHRRRAPDTVRRVGWLFHRESELDQLADERRHRRPIESGERGQARS
jgi:hypothetical protein